MYNDSQSKLACLIDIKKAQQMLDSFRKLEDDLSKLRLELLNLIFVEVEETK